MKDTIGLLKGLKIKSGAASFDVGDSVKIHQKIVEGDKERTQVFSGTVIGMRGEGINKTFKVRKISFGEGVEKTFLLHSPLVTKIEVLRKHKVRRAKLYYLRSKIGKQARMKEGAAITAPKDEETAAVSSEPAVSSGDAAKTAQAGE